jgi:hypothetical protein
MSNLGTKDVKSDVNLTIKTEEVTKKSELDKSKEVKEIKDYSNKGNEYINESLAAMIELFDKSNKNVIIHNLKVMGGEDDSHLETFKSLIKEELSKINKRLDEMESSNKANIAQKLEDLEVKITKVANSNKDKVITTIESGMLATKTETFKTIKEFANSNKGGSFIGYLITIFITVAITAGFFLSGLAK